jgi:hypothetical protein
MLYKYKHKSCFDLEIQRSVIETQSTCAVSGNRHMPVLVTNCWYVISARLCFAPSFVIQYTQPRCTAGV